jgi:hypothetical protein
MNRRSFLSAAAVAPLTASAVALGVSAQSNVPTVELSGADPMDEVRRIAAEAAASAARQVLAQVPALAVKAVSDHRRRS